MPHDTDCLTPVAEASAVARHRLFLEYLVTFLALGVLALLTMLYVLNAIGSLPAPPITATYCIDEKFKFLAEQQELEQADLLAVGSSVTWRNLDMAPFAAKGLAERPINAAPCYLHMDQIVFLTRFLLDRLTQVETVISVVAPRDFANCNEAEREFFSPDRAAPYVFDGASPLYLYIMNFRPIPFIRDAWNIAEKRASPKAFGPLFMDAYGSGPIEGTSAWSAAPHFDDRCFAALAEFEQMLAERDVQLVLVSFPSSPDWRSQHDPQGEVTQSFEARLRDSLRDDSLFTPSGAFTFDRSIYFDYVHLQWQGAQAFSSTIAGWLAAKRAAAAGG